MFRINYNTGTWHRSIKKSSCFDVNKVLADGQIIVLRPVFLLLDLSVKTLFAVYFVTVRKAGLHEVPGCENKNNVGNTDGVTTPLVF